MNAFRKINIQKFYATKKCKRILDTTYMKMEDGGSTKDGNENPHHVLNSVSSTFNFVREMQKPTHFLFLLLEEGAW